MTVLLPRPCALVLTGPTGAFGSKPVTRAMSTDAIIEAIETSPLNRGLRGIDWVSDERNIAIVQGDDIVLFDYEQDGMYQIHLLLESRGRAAIENIREAFRRMFDEHGAEILFGLVPDFRRDVKLVSRWVLRS